MKRNYDQETSKSGDGDATLVSAYSPNAVYGYIDAEPDYRWSGSVVELNPLTTHMFSHGLLLTVYLPGVKATASARVAWCHNPLVHAIDYIEVTSSSIRGKYTITGRDIEDIIQWWRNTSISNERWNRMLGNTPELQEFNRELKPYHETFMVPLFFHEEFPLYLKDLSTQGISINIKLKQPSDLLKVKYKKSSMLILDHNDVRTKTTIYKKYIEVIGSISCRTSFRVTNCRSMAEYSDRMYTSRYLPTFREFESTPNVVNMLHKAQLSIDCNVTGFMWKLEAIYPNASSLPADLHTMGCYNLDPLTGIDMDPVSMTTIEVVTGDNEVKKWEFLDTETRQNHITGMANPFQTGYHSIFFGANSLSCLKSNGIKIKKVTITCKSSDNSEINSIIDDGIDEDDSGIDEEDEYEEQSLSDKARKVPDRRLKSMSSNAPGATENPIKYRLIVRAVIVSQMEIGQHSTIFKELGSEPGKYSK
jgi:hypothetical protein